jgi:hypothetical protein
MSKRLLVCALVLLIAAGLSLAAGKEKQGSWTGWVTDTHCGAKGQNAKHAECAKKCVEGMGAKYALYTPTEQKIYVLDPQDKAAGHAVHHVTVKGSVEGETITFSSIEIVPEPTGVKPKS